MQQVLFHIPLKADWLPAWLPFWAVLAALFLLAAAALYWGGAHLAARWNVDPKSVRGAAVWVAVAGCVAAGVIAVLPRSVTDKGLPIYGFGMMLFLAFVVCNWLGGRRAESDGVPKEVVQDLAIWLIVGGLIGARVTSLLSSGVRLDNLLEHPWDAFMQFIGIWEGGIVLYGAVIGGLVTYVVAYFLVFRKQKASTLKLADIIAPTLAVGLCIGRIGCFLNGCCYGQVACPDCPAVGVPFPLSAPPRYELVKEGDQTPAGFTLAPRPAAGGGAVVGRVAPGSAADAQGLRPGDVIVKADDRPVAGPEDLDLYLGSFGAWTRGKNDLTLAVRGDDGAERSLTLWPWTLRLHPTQLYESVSMILLFLFLSAYYPFRRHDGQVMALMMVGYSMHRYVNELLRADERPGPFESRTSVVLFVAGVVLWVWLSRLPAQYRLQTAPKVDAAAPKGNAAAAIHPAGAS